MTEADTTFDDDFLDESVTTMTENALSTRAFVAIWDPANDVLFLSRPNSARNSFLTAKAGRAPPPEIMRSAFEAFQQLSVQTAQRVVRFTAARERAAQTDAA